MTKEELLQTYFYIEDISGSENTVSITKYNASAPTLLLEYSTDGSTWTTATMNEDTTANTFTLPANGKLYLRGVNNVWCNIGYNYYNSITCSGKHDVGGNIMSLLYGNNFIGKTTFPTTNNYVFNSLFINNTNLVNAQDLQLPATTLTSGCYYSMFNNCSKLTTTPELPATTLNSQCYFQMFYNCTSLTTAPELPATTLANKCYQNMFNGCSKLTTAPELPATTLVNACYYMMFNGCTNLTTAPELPATTLAKQCYQNMFSGTNVLPDCSNIDFTSETVVKSRGLNGLFGGTKVTDEDLMEILPINPETNHYYLPVMNLGDFCYSSMFSGCKNLTTAPELPATTLAQSCYNSMFYGCSSLTTAPELPATTLASSCYSTMFTNCTNLTTAPSILPATTLAQSCYLNMFNSCSSLTTAPELPATTLTTSCYQTMFQECRKLNFIKADFIDYNSNYLSNWVNGVSNTGLFIMNPDANYNPEEIRGKDGIPTGWNAKNSIGVTFINIDSSKTNYLTINKLEGLYNNIELIYSTNYIDWVAVEDLSQPIEFKKQLSLRGINNSLEGYSFSCTESYSVNGNIMELLLGEEADTLGNVFPENSVNTFKSLFKNSDNLVDISKLKLTSGDLVKGCYEQMFCGCKNLKTAPTLPSLNLSKLCYSHMFTGCKNMEVAPVLPAIELQPYCYHGMFMGCHHLNTIEANFLNYSNNNHEFDDWMLNVDKQGKFIINSESTYDVETIRGVDGIPLNWDVTSNDSTEI